MTTIQKLLRSNRWIGHQQSNRFNESRRVRLKVAAMDNKTEQEDESSESNHPDGQPKKPILVLINPHSGRGQSESIFNKKVLPLLNSHSIDHQVFITKADSRINNFIENKSLSELTSFKSILVVSGDGLFHETVNSIMRRPDWQQAIKVPIGIVPTGSGNGLAYTLLRQRHPDLRSKDEAIRLCCEQAIQNETRVADLIKITYGQGKTVWSFLSFGWGLLADIDVDSDWLRMLGDFRFTIYGLLRSVTSKAKLGTLSYKTASSKGLNKTNDKADEVAHSATIAEKDQDDWTHVEDRFTCIYAVYQSYVSSFTKFAPKSTLTDQIMYLTYIRGPLNPCQIVEFLISIDDGSHERLPYVTVVPVSEFTFLPREQSKVVVDGEIIPYSASDGHLRAEIVPKVLNLMWSPQVD